MVHLPHPLGSAAYRAMSVIALGVIMIAINSPASAHPGHGVTPDGQSPAHCLLEPAHGLGAFVLIIATAACLAIIRSRAIARRSLS
jgi:hypothetical protein